MTTLPFFSCLCYLFIRLFFKSIWKPLVAFILAKHWWNDMVVVDCISPISYQ